MILCAYRYIREHGKDAREPLYGDLLTAALYAGLLSARQDVQPYTP